MMGLTAEFPAGPYAQSEGGTRKYFRYRADRCVSLKLLSLRGIPRGEHKRHYLPFKAIRYGQKLVFECALISTVLRLRSYRT